MLTPRRIEIFKAIVDEYIRTAEPVGSKALQQKYHLPYSSATIRNDMQVLEEMGYLEKTHTSSGRIPSTQGYKFYCENLLSGSGMDRRMEVAIRDAFDAANLNIEEAIHQSCQILSEMTNMTSGAIGPDSSKQRLSHIKLFPLDDRNAVCVFITNTGHTETRTFHFDQAVSVSDIEVCTEILNDRLKDVPLSDLVERMEDIRPQLASVVERHEILFTAFVQAFVRFASENVYFSGKDRMLYQPEFEDIGKLKQLMMMLDDSTVWREIGNSDNAVAVRTSQGTELTWLNDVAIVRSTFRVSDDESGQLMVVGPSRMNYDQVVSMIGYTAKMIEKMYNGGGEKKK
ncbi:MAG: heat-inducible transcription repressor HrcA [Erysipelotrichaceae bacterium]|nr:heat-inducible transcription repressor HrcA [Erysipelotrichaceae bacterium]